MSRLIPNFEVIREELRLWKSEQAAWRFDYTVWQATVREAVVVTREIEQEHLRSHMQELIGADGAARAHARALEECERIAALGERRTTAHNGHVENGEETVRDHIRVGDRHAQLREVHERLQLRQRAIIN